jgi:outer membrane receptor protein involved in Fe transport
MIVNVGIRFDYFDPKAFVPFDPDDPVNPGYDNINDPRYGEVRNPQERLKNPVEADRKHQLSPRVGLSYPITEKDVLHVTYGHYFQLPVFDDFYTNYAYDLRGAFKYIGNPDLKEQKTVAYEAGLEHGFNDFLKVSITGYFKDISNLINQQLIQNPVTGARYYRYINVDYARIKGFEVAFTQRPWNNVTGLLTYTYQIAKGRASAKDQGFEDVYFLYKPRTEDYPLDWDQRHTAKANINYRIPPSANKLMGDWGIDFVFTYGSGKPYSSTARVIKPNLPPINDKNLPDSWEINVRLDKGFDVYKSMNINAFVEVRNLTDRANIIDLIDADKYDVSGYPAGPLRDPLVYSAPRRILLGAQLTF